MTAARIAGWTYDIAREQAPSERWLHLLCERSLSAGYNFLGLYLEHRFAYPSAPWAWGAGALRPEVVRGLQDTYRSAGLRIVPFLNTLGHMEGFIRARGGEFLREGPAPFSCQMCPSRAECVEFARKLVTDALAVFDDEWVHLGGDEAWELGSCPRCKERVQSEGPGGIYGSYFGDLCRWLLQQGRRPCLWGDMLLKHPEAMGMIPKETVIFDWQYNDPPERTSRQLRDAGFEVVCCPALHTYHAAWCDLPRTFANVDEHRSDAEKLGAAGVVLTTWEFINLSHYDAALPLIFAAGRRIAQGADWDFAIRAEGGERYAEAAHILGERVLDAAPGLKRLWPVAARFRHALLRGYDPFELWRFWGAEALGKAGSDVLHLCRQVQELVGPDHDLAFPALYLRVGVQWVRLVEQAREAYDRGGPAPAAEALHRGDALLDEMRPWLERIARHGGSAVDPERLKRVRRAIGTVVSKLRALEGRRDGALPAFGTLVRPGYVPGDQASWMSDALDEPIGHRMIAAPAND